MSPKWKFIVIYGCLGWGLTTYVVFTLISILVRHQHFNRSDLLIGFVIWPIAGLAWGASVWSSRQRPRKQGANKP
jgi:hypothetical protein